MGPPPGLFGGISQMLDPARVQNQLNFAKQEMDANARQANFGKALQDFNLKINTDEGFKKTVSEIQKFHPRAESSPESFAKFTVAAEAHGMNQRTIAELTENGLLDPEQAKTFNKTSLLDPDRVANQLNNYSGMALAKQREDNAAAQKAAGEDNIQSVAIEAFKSGGTVLDVLNHPSLVGDGTAQAEAAKAYQTLLDDRNKGIDRTTRIENDLADRGQKAADQLDDDVDEITKIDSQERVSQLANAAITQGGTLKEILNAPGPMTEAERLAAAKQFIALGGLTAGGKGRGGKGGSSTAVNLDELTFVKGGATLATAANNIVSETQLTQFVNTPHFKALAKKNPGLTEEFTDRARKSFSGVSADVGRRKMSRMDDIAHTAIMNHVADSFDSFMPGAWFEKNLTKENIEAYLLTEAGTTALRGAGISFKQFGFIAEEKQKRINNALLIANLTSIEGRQQMGEVVKAGGKVIENGKITLEEDIRFTNTLFDNSEERKHIKNNPGVKDQLVVNTPGGPAPAIELDSGEFVVYEFSDPRKSPTLYTYVEGPKGKDGKSALVRGAEITHTQEIATAELVVHRMGRNPIPKVRELVRKLLMGLKKSDKAEVNDVHRPLGALAVELRSVLGTLDAFADKGAVFGSDFNALDLSKATKGKGDIVINMGDGEPTVIQQDPSVGRDIARTTSLPVGPSRPAPREERTGDFDIAVGSYIKLITLRQRLRSIDRNLFVTPPR